MRPPARGRDIDKLWLLSESSDSEALWSCLLLETICTGHRHKYSIVSAKYIKLEDCKEIVILFGPNTVLDDSCVAPSKCHIICRA